MGGSHYGYENENRLTAAQVLYQDDWGQWQGWRTTFAYDGLGRLRRRVEWTPDVGEDFGLGLEGLLGGGFWYPEYAVDYLYDGWRVIQERAATTPLVSYTRGIDLSGSLEGAGGIGGLLARSSGYSGGNWTSHAYYHADGNGNITCLINASQSVVASYRYDPFGNTISKTGTLADANVYHFSSKEVHFHSGLYYYGYRFYDPSLQRWMNRDPIQEKGGINLYTFVLNEPSRRLDPFGLACPSGYRSGGTFWGFPSSRTITATVTGTRSWTEYQKGPPPTTCEEALFKSRDCEQPVIANQDYIVTTEFQYEVCQKGYGTGVETMFVFSGQSRTSGPVPTGQPYNVRPNGPVKCGDWKDATGPVVAALP